ncbi:transcription initiation factor TFIID subunit 4-like [Arapaima gigas]
MTSLRNSLSVPRGQWAWPQVCGFCGVLSFPVRYKHGCALRLGSLRVNTHRSYSQAVSNHRPRGAGGTDLRWSNMPVEVGEDQTPSVGGATVAAGGQVAPEAAAGCGDAREENGATQDAVPLDQGVSNGQSAPCPGASLCSSDAVSAPAAAVCAAVAMLDMPGASVNALGAAAPTVSAAGAPGTPVFINLHASGVSSAPSSTNTSAAKIVISGRRLSTDSLVAVTTRANPSLTVLPPKTAGQGGLGLGLAPGSQVRATRVATVTQALGKGTVITLPRVAAPQASGGPRSVQSSVVQLPANFQIPQGMMLIRSESGQLMLVSQQALAQAQAQGIVPRAPGAATGSVTRISIPQATGGAVSTPAGHSVRPTVPKPGSVPLVIPAKPEGPKTTPAGTISAETLENVKKCKNFLVTLIKLASSGTHSAEMAKNVKELVKSLLDGKTEPEEFTDKLYTELKSSPQPYLVPFLKRSLPAVRQLTPNSQLFIQQCAPLSSTKPTPVPTTAAATTGQTESKSLQSSPAVGQPLKTVQTARPAQLVIQQPRGVVINQSAVPVSVQNRAAPKQLVTTPQTTSQPTGTAVKHSPLQVSKIVSTQPPQGQKNSFKDIASASFRDEDDINDVASMAGVNLSEENARILATNSEHVGALVRSCRDDPFLPVAVLQKRIMETGNPWNESPAAAISVFWGH